MQVWSIIKIPEYVKYVQTKFWVTAKIIRSDRGDEYTGEKLKVFFSKNEVKQMQLTNPYTTERKNRYLVDVVRSVLVDTGLRNKYWEAVVTANHIPNRSSVTGRGKTLIRHGIRNQIWMISEDLVVRHIIPYLGLPPPATCFQVFKDKKNPIRWGHASVAFLWTNEENNEVFTSPLAMAF